MSAPASYGILYWKQQRFKELLKRFDLKVEDKSSMEVSCICMCMQKQLTMYCKQVYELAES